jgi:dTDP-4-amino-4,6-dideoxygalactose transaminase
MEAVTGKLPMAVSKLAEATPAAIAFVDLAAQQQRIRARVDAAMKRVLDHGQYIMGPEIASLEQHLSAFCGAKHAISCASGTDALLMAMMALEVKPGDAILCPGFTYTATPETIALLGAEPVFVDVDADTFNVDPKGLAAGLAAAVRRGLKPVGIIAVDLFGLPARYDEIEAFAVAHKLWVMSDAAQSFGARAGAKAAGQFGTITATSFFPAKPLGCYGDGGAIFTEDDHLASVMRSIRLHGKGEGADKYEIVRIGVNGRLDTLQAAILIEKLAIFVDEIAARNVVADRYTAALKSHVITPPVPLETTSVWAQYTVRIKNGRRDAVRAFLEARGIPTMIYYPKPLHHQIAYRQYAVAGNGLPVSERLPGEVLSLPMHPYLDVATQDRIIEGLLEALAV